jgi:hypothetical protein
MAPVIKWFTPDQIKGSVPAYLKKFDSKSVNGSKDTLLFYKALSEAMMLSEKSTDDDKKEYAEIINDDVEEYGSLAYFISVRGAPDQSTIMVMKPGEKKLGTWTGTFEPLADCKQNVYMDMTPQCSEKICYGNPNTDAEFFSGALTVKGPLKLATKPRSWIGAFFEFLEREVD